MTTAITKQNTSAIPALSMSEDELAGVLTNSLYPGAAYSSIKLVIGYCKASGLDPMQKPVHIVPMYDSKSKQMRDVVMPGIGLYRTQAARSGEYAGVTEPEFGEDVAEDLGGVRMTYPKWCRVTVRRLMANGMIVDFTAKELWKENYATKGRDSSAPNAMWQRRPYAQLAKCAEAQALRKAFPEFGAQPTADEMEGRDLTVDAAEVVEQPKTIAGIAKARAEQRKAHGPSLDDVLAAIEEARDKESLAAAKALGAQMPDGPEKDQAVAAYGARVDELKALAQQQSEDGGTFADAHAAVQDGDFDLARDIARSLPDGQRKQIESAIQNIETAAQA